MSELLVESMDRNSRTFRQRNEPHASLCWDQACVHWVHEGFRWHHMCRAAQGDIPTKQAQGRPQPTYEAALKLLADHQRRCRG